MKKSMIILATCSLLWFSRADIANAIIFVDSGPPPFPGAAANIHATQFLAQQFTLPIAATITEIAVSLARIGTGPDPVVLVQLTDAIGLGTPPGAVLFQASLTVTNDFSNQGLFFLPISTSLFLQAGTYFLVLSSNAESANSAAWGENAPMAVGPEFFAGPPRIMNSAFPPASEFFGPVQFDFGLRISGVPGLALDLAEILANRGFEDDLVHSQWIATKINKNYRFEAPVVNPIIIPKDETSPLEAPAGNNFIGILNPQDADLNGRLVHQAVAAFFPAGTVFHVTVWANRGRLQNALGPEFESQPSEVSVQFFGWGSGSTPVVNPNTDNWSRTTSVNILQSFTNWAANGEWASQTFVFVITKDLSYISLALTGKNHIKATYAAFDIIVPAIPAVP